MLVASGLVKHYGGVTALDGVGITLDAGEVHALVGENGAGKSTLVKIVSGVVRPEGGTLALDGAPVRFAGARHAGAQGVAIVSQELMTYDDLTVLENLFPYGAPRRRGLVSTREMRRLARPVLGALGIDPPPHARAGDLPLADRQLLEICRALLQEPRVLILDEPTSALPRDAAERLAGVVRRLAGRGLAVLYISHFLEEVMRIADRVTVLRDGRVVLPGAAAADVSLDSLVAAMLGEPEARAAVPSPNSKPAVRRRPSGAAVSLTGVTVPGLLRDVSLAVAGGEIVGLAGLQGAGHLAVLDAVCGRVRPASGSVRLPDGREPRSARHAVTSGVAFVSGDRKGRGLMLDKPLWENVTAVSWLGQGRGGFLPRRARLVDRARGHLERLRVRGDVRAGAGALSGGNQQKVVLAKWLDASPSVLALDDPTRGVDVGARAELHAIVRGLAAEGKAVLIASSDLAELVELCHRVVVFQHGRIVGSLAGARLTEPELSVAMNAGFAGRAR
ncbi:sugar ABC transporter ATP-binding protein [Actinomadura verrucosospora]|uniref:Putative sugar ABC transporter, ATP-binding protein n=1 Tax=Actinomadura verrucosospora TaxID=46165 RepID=A0A7D4AWH0_ACTVE|nr:sugar ABC transporter ATP-binding protein [Actinomadura verrucosospora]QKG27428.1 putative sugar ABC transporter, ATP-binding protein [Actinomadura verrucosospora]